MQQLFTFDNMQREAKLIDGLDWIKVSGDDGDTGLAACLVGLLYMTVEVQETRYFVTISVFDGDKEDVPTTLDELVPLFDYYGLSVAYTVKQCIHFFERFYTAIGMRLSDTERAASVAEKSMGAFGMVTGAQRSRLAKIDEEFTGTTREEASAFLRERE